MKLLATTLGFALAVTGLTAASGCGPTGMYASVESSPPGPPQSGIYFESRSGYVWVEGHYVWDGARWNWVDGYWVDQRPGYVYVQGYWDSSGGRYHWVDGHWAAQRPGHVWVRGYWSGGVWVRGRWQAERRGQHWHRGHWDRRGNQRVWVEGSWRSQPVRDHRSPKKKYNPPPKRPKKYK